MGARAGSTVHACLVGARLAVATNVTSDLAFSIGLFAGWLALVVWLVWPDPHCACCAKRAIERVRDRL